MIRIGGPPLQRGVVLKWFFSLSRRNTFVGGTCALPSALLVNLHPLTKAPCRGHLQRGHVQTKKSANKNCLRDLKYQPTILANLYRFCVISFSVWTLEIVLKVSKSGYLYSAPESWRRVNGAGRSRTGTSSVPAEGRLGRCWKSLKFVSF